MAMLAERKSKNKWVLNPRGSNAINEMQFGRKMLEKMGWQSGDGLGVNKQGSTEPLRVQYKNDVKGIGYKKNVDNEWLKVEDEFSKFLQNLSSDVDVNANDEINLESLEKKSEGSKARLHYRKFTRNKDLSRYTEKDLSCILGFGKNSETVEDETIEGNGKFVDKGSINGYFEQKAQKKFVQNSIHEVNEIKSADGNECKSEKKKSSKKTKKSEEAADLEVSEYNNVFINDSGSEEVRGGSKRKKYSDGTVENCMEGRDSDDSKTKTKKFKKKNKLENAIESEQDLMTAESAESYQVNGTVTDSKKKNKSKKRKFPEVMESDDSISKKHSQEVNEGFSMKSIEENSPDGNRENKPKKKKLKLENKLEDFLEKTEQDVIEKTKQVLIESSDDAEKRNRKKKSQDKKMKSDKINEDNCTEGDHFNISNHTNRNEKMKYKKKKCEEVNETEAMINVQMQEKDDSLRIGKDSKKKEKNKRKKRKQIDLHESGICGGSSDENSAEFCDKFSDGSIEKTILNEDKNLPNKAVAMKKESKDEELLPNTIPRTGEKICDSLADSEADTPNNSSKKVRFDHLQNFEKEREDHLQSEDIDHSEERRSKKSKKQKLVENGKFENFHEVDGCEKRVEMEQTEASESMNNDQEKRSKDKSSKRLKCKIKVKTEEPIEDLDTKNLKVECIISDECLRKKKKKSKSKEVAEEELKDQETKTEKTIIDFDTKKVKVECDSLSDDSLKKKKYKSKKSEVLGEETEEGMKNRISIKEEEGAFCDNFHESGESRKKSKSKKHKQIHEKDLIKNSPEPQKSEKIEVNLNLENCSFNSNETKDVSDKKAKLLALLEKTTKDDSDDSDSDSDSKPVTNLPNSCFKGSNFEQIPGYRIMKAR